MNTNYTTQDRGDKESYQSYLEAMDALAIEKVASASTFFEPKSGNRLVDIGMASGTSTAILAQLFPQMEVIGVDINPVMVSIAQKNYQLPNLIFREDDGEKLHSFEKNSVDGFFNCSSVHHITSYNNYDTNHALHTFRRQVELLREKGVIVVRDFVKPEEQEVILELSTIEKPDRPDDSSLLFQFASTARSLAEKGKRGFPVEEVRSEKKDTRRFRLFYTDAVEFIRRKDYYENWEIELQEEYGYLTQKEFENVFRELGLRIIISSPIYNPWIIRNRYKGEFTLYDLAGNDIGFPPTNYLIAGEKCSGGKQLQLVRHLPQIPDSFLTFSSYRNKQTGKVYDVVERPNEVLDIIPFYRQGNQLKVWVKRGYPRPLANLQVDSPVLDGKYYSGYIPEGIAIGKTEDLADVLQSRFDIVKEDYKEIKPLLNYYTSPGGINEYVSSQVVELSGGFTNDKVLKDGFSDFRDSGIITISDAAQLLRTAQTGALVEARLEMNLYQLFFRENIPLPQWLGEPVQIESIPVSHAVCLSDLVRGEYSLFEESKESAGFLSTRRACFAEMGITDSSVVLEYVFPAELSLNTVVTLPVCEDNGEMYVGLEVRHLPVPQIHSGNSLLISSPAKRLPKSITNLYELQAYIGKMNIGTSSVKQYSKLGEKYFPSVGVTPEQVYPYVVCLDKADESLQWVRLTELTQHMDKIQDAHLLICLSRLIHASEVI